MDLPEILQPRRGEQDLHRVGLSALTSAVVEDRHPRFEGMDEDL
jgi:hypothetical protein